jgi:hypothetical protein
MSWKLTVFHGQHKENMTNSAGFHSHHAAPGIDSDLIAGELCVGGVLAPQPCGDGGIARANQHGGSMDDF